MGLVIKTPHPAEAGAKLAEPPVHILQSLGTERFVVTVESPKGDRVSPCTVFYVVDVFGLLPGFPDHVNACETWVQNKSSRIATMASDKSAGSRAKARELSSAEFIWPRQIR